MTPHDQDKLEPALEQLFEGARRASPELAEDFLAKLERTALAVQPASPRDLWFWWREIGGWWGVSGIVTAGCAGLWIGVMPPEGLNALPVEADDTWFVADDDPSFGWMVEEEQG